MFVTRRSVGRGVRPVHATSAGFKLCGAVAVLAVVTAACSSSGHSKSAASTPASASSSVTPVASSSAPQSAPPSTVVASSSAPQSAPASIPATTPTPSATVAASSAAPSASAMPVVPPGKATVSLAFWSHAQLPVGNALAAAFTKLYPNIKVEIQVTAYGDYFTKLSTAISGGSAPDVFWLNEDEAKLYEAGKVLQPLNSFIQQNGINLAAYDQSVVAAYRYNGIQYALPRDQNTVGLCYNKAIFDKAGVAYPNNSWTWQTLENAAVKLTNPATQTYGIVSAEYDQQNYYQTIAQAGGGVISANGKTSLYDTPAAEAGISFWTDLINKYHASPTAKQMDDVDPETMFESGKIAMYYCGSWELTAFQQIPALYPNLGVAVMPAGKLRVTVTDGEGYAVWAKSPHLAAADALDWFMTSPQGQQIQAQTGGAIPALNSAQHFWSAQWGDRGNAFITSLKGSLPFPASMHTAVWENAAEDEFNNVWHGTESVDAGAKNITAFMNSALAKESS